MFLKVIFKTAKTTGQRVSYYRLCGSYHCDNPVKHYTILHLGTLTELPSPEQKQQLATRIAELVKQHYTGTLGLFRPEAAVESLAQQFFEQIQQQHRLDVATGKDYRRIDTNSLEHKDVREVGTEWLCKQAIDQLGIAGFLATSGWEQPQIQLALTHIISRATYPASELRTSHWIQQNSSVCELTGYPADNITKDKLHTISHRLYAVKEDLEKFVSHCTSELFDLPDKIIFYDLTNTFPIAIGIEGALCNSSIARFGRSNEKRSDARLVVLIPHLRIGEYRGLPEILPNF